MSAVLNFIIPLLSLLFVSEAVFACAARPYNVEGTSIEVNAGYISYQKVDGDRGHFVQEDNKTTTHDFKTA